MSTSSLPVAKTTQAAPHRRHFIQPFEIALFSVRSVQKHSLFRLFLQIFWTVEFPRTNFRHTPAPFFSIFYSSCHFKFSFDVQNLPSFRHCSHITIPPVSC